MVNPQQAEAHLTYEPELNTETGIAANEPAPTGTTDGVDGYTCKGRNFATVSIDDLTGITSYDIEVWLYNGRKWKHDPALDELAKVADFDRRYQISTYDRIKFRIVGIAGAGTLVKNTITSV
jgi:hypothetical protein